MISIVACCHGAKLCAHAARDFRSQRYKHKTVNTPSVEHVTADGVHMNQIENRGGTLSEN